MNEDKALGIATRIKHPISLAALTVLVLAVIGLAVVRSLPISALGNNDTRDLVQMIIGVVAAIAVIGLACALLFIRPVPPHYSSIQTYGDLSPGKVKNYKATVTGTPTHTAKDHASTGADIETHGFASPGDVDGNYEVDIKQPPKK